MKSTEATPLVLAHAFCARRRAVEGPWLDFYSAQIDGIISESAISTRNC